MKRVTLGLIYTTLYCAFFMWCSPWVHAHRLEVDVFTQNQQLVFYVTTEGNEAEADCHVTIVDEAGAVLADGHTNESGHFSWSPETISTVTVRAIADDGHKKTFEITNEEMGRWLAQDETGRTNEESVQTVHDPTDHQHDSDHHHEHDDETEPASDHHHEASHAHETDHKHAADSEPEMVHVHSTGSNPRTTERVVLGLTFLMAGWAAWSSSRNARKLDRIHELLKNRDPNT